MPEPSSPFAWTALVVEDEPRLRQALVDHLRQASFPWRDILQAGQAEEALALVRACRPEVAFLDIRMPGMSGLELASRLPAGMRLVFVTAYDAHAVEAFEAGAVDYLLKPVTLERLQKTLDRIRERTPPPVDALRELLQRVAPPAHPEHLRWITATSGRRTRWIAVEEVLYFQADSKYTRVEARDGSFVICQTLKDLAAQLDPAMFQQIHRATIVNLQAVAWLERQDAGGGRIHLRGRNEVLAVTASFIKALKARN